MPAILIHRASLRRLVLILHHFLTALEAKGIAWADDDKGISVAIGPDKVQLEFKEERRRQKREPTPAEIKRQQDFDRRSELARRRGGWLPYERFWPEYDYIYSGKFSFEIQNWADGARRRWNDGKHRTLEAMVEDMADGVLFYLSFERARREETEARERRRQHMAQRRALHKQREDREAQRVSFLGRLTAYHKEAADLSAIIAVASTLYGGAPPDYLRMIAWAQQRLSLLEQENSTAIIAARLREEDLFPETDELVDPEGDPPPKRGYWDE